MNDQIKITSATSYLTNHHSVSTRKLNLKLNLKTKQNTYTDTL